MTPAAHEDRCAYDAAVRTSEVNVIFTTIDGTMAALRVAAALARACQATIRLIVPQSPTLSPPADGHDVRSPVESGALHARIESEIDAHVDVLVCVSRDVAAVARMLLRTHALVVIGGRRRWWPTRHERLRRTLEAHGHFVLFVNQVD
jgi:hypothetical protein